MQESSRDAQVCAGEMCEDVVLRIIIVWGCTCAGARTDDEGELCRLENFARELILAHVHPPQVTAFLLVATWQREGALLWRPHHAAAHMLRVDELLFLGHV